MPASNWPGNRSRIRHALVIGAVAAVAVLGYQVARSHDDSRRDATTPATAPSGASDEVTWRNVAGIRVPTSTLHGPQCIDGRLVSCFEDTDAGAAYAAANVLVRTFAYVGPATFGPTISRQVIGPDQPDLARTTADSYTQAAKAADVKDGAPLRAEGGQVTGYRIIEPYDGPQNGERNVGVLVAQASPELDGAFVEYVVHVRRVSGDWLLTAPVWGDWRLAAHDVGNPQSQQWNSFDKAAGR